MENQKIINLLDQIDTDSKHFATKKWYIINDENNTHYGVNKDTGVDNQDTIKYDTRVLKPNLCDCAEAYILVDGTIRAAAADASTRLALKNRAPFTKCNLEINDEHVDTAENLDITMPMYNLIEYSDNYQDSSAIFYQIKRDEPPEANAIDDLAVDNLSSFKYKISLLGNPVVADNIARRSVKVVVPLKYLSNSFRSLEMPLINCKIKLNLTWKKNVYYQLMMVMQYLLLMIQKCTFQLLLCQKKIKKILLSNKKKGFQRSIYRSTKNYLLLYSRFKVGDRVRISKFKNIFAKGYAPNWCREIFIVNKVNDTVPYTYNLKDLNDEEIIGSFYDKELQKTKLL